MQSGVKPWPRSHRSVQGSLLESWRGSGVLCPRRDHNLAGRSMSEEALIVRIPYRDTSLERLNSLEEALREAIDWAGGSGYDRHEITVDGSECTLCLYGPSADLLFEAVKRELED